MDHREKQAHISGVSHLLGVQMVTFEVGSPSPISFVVHKRLLANKVPVFSNISSSNTSYGPLGSIVFLPDDKPEVFAFFLDWVYTGEICIEIGTTMKETEPTMSALLELYYFANKHSVPVLPDLIMDKILSISQQFKTSPCLKVVDAGYANTLDGSKLRLYLVRCFTLYALRTHEEQGQNYSPDALHTLAMKHPDLSKDFFHTVGGLKADSEHPSLSPRCDYHEHSWKVACPHV